MRENSIVKYRGSDLGIVLISSKQSTIRSLDNTILQATTLNLIKSKNGSLIAAGDDELEFIADLDDSYKNNKEVI